MIEKNQNKSIQHSQVIMGLLVVYDAIVVSAAYFLALLLRFDLHFSNIPEMYLVPWEKFAPIYAVICIAVFAMLHLYKSIWRFASYTELLRIIMSSVITFFIH